jgi:hypothetical protein
MGFPVAISATLQSADLVQNYTVAPNRPAERGAT